MYLCTLIQPYLFRVYPTEGGGDGRAIPYKIPTSKNGYSVEKRTAVFLGGGSLSCGGGGGGGAGCPHRIRVHLPEQLLSALLWLLAGSEARVRERGTRERRIRGGDGDDDDDDDQNFAREEVMEIASRLARENSLRDTQDLFSEHFSELLNHAVGDKHAKRMEEGGGINTGGEASSLCADGVDDGGGGGGCCRCRCCFFLPFSQFGTRCVFSAEFMYCGIVAGKVHASLSALLIIEQTDFVMRSSVYLCFCEGDNEQQVAECVCV